ncbi:MAG: isochorismatase family protein, partial [Acidimicrobiales bacterium]|nr:isochorismatase family protein [Acidimicrobiales bacterium]
MAPALADLLAPPTTAVIAMEMQRGVTGDLAMMTELRDLMVSTGVIDNVAAVVRGARTAGARVVHCRAISRSDGAGRKNNARILTATAESARAMVDGSAAAEVIPELGVEPADIDMPRLHGLTPFTGTSLDRVLR